MGRLAAAAALAGLLCTVPAWAGDKEPAGSGAALPPVLKRHGFGHATHPVRVTFTAPIGSTQARPTRAGTGAALPGNTLWVFQDPAPVWAALAKARTRRFHDGMFPGADARITIDASHGGVRRRVHLHYRAGEGDISVRRDKGRYGGGAWSFAPEADAALVALLSRTPPTALGASPLKVFQLYRPKAHKRHHARVWAFHDPVSLKEARDAYRQRYGSIGNWTLPPGFDWKTHMLVGLELGAGGKQLVLDWSGARVRKGVLAWEVGTRPEDREAIPRGSASTLIGVFRRIAGLKHVRADFRNGKQVEMRYGSADDYHTPQPDAVFLRITERVYVRGENWIEVGTIDVRWAGQYVVRRDTGSLYGRIPMPLCFRLRTSFGAKLDHIDMLRSPPPPKPYALHLDDTKTRHPDGIRDLVEYLAAAHGH